MKPLDIVIVVAIGLTVASIPYMIYKESTSVTHTDCTSSKGGPGSNMFGDTPERENATEKNCTTYKTYR